MTKKLPDLQPAQQNVNILTGRVELSWTTSDGHFVTASGDLPGQVKDQVAETKKFFAGLLRKAADTLEGIEPDEGSA